VLELRESGAPMLWAPATEMAAFDAAVVEHQTASAPRCDGIGRGGVVERETADASWRH